MSPPPQRLEEAFPPDEREFDNDRVAGPSGSAREKGRSAPAKGKRKTRRLSNESSSRHDSPARVTSPSAKDRGKEKEKKRAKTDKDPIERPASRSSKGKEKANSPVDTEPRRKASTITNGSKAPSQKSAKLNVNDKDAEEKRMKSPLVQPDEVDDDEEEEEEEEEEIEEVEEKDDAKSREERERLQRMKERRSSSLWIGDENVTILSDHRDAVSYVLLFATE